MVNLISTELLKLKRSKMLLLSALGAAVPPFLVVLGFYIDLMSKPTKETEIFEVLFYNTSMYTVLLIGVLLYSVVIAYLFSREYTEDTLKHLLTIPVSRTNLILSKMLLLLLWVVVLTIEAWGLTIVFGLLAQFEGITINLLLQSFTEYMIGALLLVALSTPIVLITVVMKNYVPAIIAAISITLVNLFVFDSDYRRFNPWTAAFDIAHGTLPSPYLEAVSYIIIAATSIGGLASTLLYFRKADIT